MKDKLINELRERLTQFFVDDFDKVCNAKNNINIYLESIEVDGRYDYNDFCADFLRVSDSLISSLTLEDIEALDSIFIMSEIMSVMVKYKIIESEKDEMIRNEKLIQHELRTRATMGFDSS